MNGHKIPLETWPWHVADSVQSDRFDSVLTVHDSSLIDPVILDTSSQKAILVFDWDTHWNRNLLPIDFNSSERCLLAIAINDVMGTDSSSNFAVMPDGIKPTNIVMGLTVVEAEQGCRTTIEVLGRPDFCVDHLGGFEVLCMTVAGVHVPLRLCASA